VRFNGARMHAPARNNRPIPCHQLHLQLATPALRAKPAAFRCRPHPEPSKACDPRYRLHLNPGHPFSTPHLCNPSTGTLLQAPLSQATKMPRRSGGGGGGRAPSRPMAAPSYKPAPTQQQQTRPATTMAAPQQHNKTMPPQGAGASQGPGLIGQMASTAAYETP
jgi:hypothetical protein